MSKKLAVIGLGNMGLNHVRIYKELGVLIAVCDVRYDHAKKIGQQYNVPFYSDIISLLASHGLDGVTVAVPTPFHLETVHECLDAKVHVLCEKPISDNLKDAKKMVSEAKKNNCILAVGYVENFNPAFQALNILVQEGGLGNLTSVNIKRVGGIPRSADNVILDLMTHDFNLLLTLFDKYPEKIDTHARYDKGLLDSAQVLLDFGKASATCEANWISPIKIRSIQATGTEGYCEVDMIKQQITRFKSGLMKERAIKYLDFVNANGFPQVLDVSNFNQEPLKEELKGFIEAIKNTSLDTIVSGESGINTLRLTLDSITQKSEI